jgi:nitronate monooxygenase
LSCARNGAEVGRDIWGSGQGIGAVEGVELVARLKREYAEAKKRICS